MTFSRRQIILFIVVPVLLYFGFTSINRALETYSLQQSADRVRAEIEELRDRQAELLRQHEYLESDEYIERIAREELDLIRPGDMAIVVIAPDPEDEQDPEAEAEEVDRGPPNWQLWLDFFFAEERA